MILRITRITEPLVLYLKTPCTRPMLFMTNPTRFTTARSRLDDLSTQIAVTLQPKRNRATHWPPHPSAVTLSPASASATLITASAWQKTSGVPHSPGHTASKSRASCSHTTADTATTHASEH